MTETKGGVKLLGGSVALDYLEIGVFRSVFPAFRQKSGADLPGKPLTAVLFFYMDSRSRIPSPVAMIFPSFWMKAQIVSLGMARYIDGTTVR